MPDSSGQGHVGYLRIAAEEVTAHDELPLTPARKKALFQTNAERVFRL
jgi:hypothetical protein